MDIPSSLRDYLTMSAVAMRENNFEGALEIFNLILNSPELPEPLKSAILGARAKVHRNLDMKYHAFCDACDGLKLDPNEPECLRYKAMMFEECGKLQDAKDLYVRITTLYPNDRMTAACVHRISTLLEGHSPSPPLASTISHNPDDKSLETVRQFMKSQLEGLRPDPSVVLEIIRRGIANLDITGPIARLDTETKVTVVGNLDGRMGHLMRIFDRNGYPSRDNRYIFNGNIIGKKENAASLMVSLLYFKYADKESVYFNQGA